MRFFADGPDLPDELLAARDEGQVLFFCGSGVSLARSGLPNFFGLADDVIEGLGAANTSRARAVVRTSREVGHIDGVGGLVPADRVFSLLEEEFSVGQVRQAVAAALRPKHDDLSAHRTILDVARGTDGEVRLVTTNFDPLFEACDPSLSSHSPPDLPDPSRTNRFIGIVHLHGRVTTDYAVPDDEEFVLSSADFGRAYLADGWATRFMRALIDRYQLIFLGYAADDPPVQYLLEALGRGTSRNRLYAFQAGDDEQAKALWRYRGVEAIAYDEANGHAALWNTMEAWAERARDPGAWLERVLRRGEKGPSVLEPFERGQVAHAVSTVAGAKLLARSDTILPAEWLCVFEPNARYGEPGSEDFDPNSSLIDPFLLWGLDRDEVPSPYNPEDRSKKRETPDGAWSAFSLSRQDRASLDEHPSPRFYGSAHQQVAALPTRLDHLGNWVAKVSSQPAALWWAAGMTGLHPHVARRIVRGLESNADDAGATLREGWRYLLAERDAREPAHPSEAFYRLDEAVKRDGWTESRARTLADLRRPKLQIGRAWMSRRPPERLERLSDVLRFDIHYPDADVLRDVPQEFIGPYARQLTETIAAACALELEITGLIFSLGPFTKDAEDEEDGPGGAGDDLTALFRTWISNLASVAIVDPEFIRGELASWRRRSEAPFVRATIWAAGLVGAISPETSGEIFAGLSVSDFWDQDHQRDLLNVLSARWAELSAETQEAIGVRLLAGPDAHESETVDEHTRRAAWRILERLQWLHGQGCAFGFDFEAEMARLRALEPQWIPEASEAADESREIRVRTVTEDTDPKVLLDIPLEEILPRAAELSQQRHAHFVEVHPFTGLSRDHPERALAALALADAGGARWAWETFLGAETRAVDSAELVASIGTAILNIDAAKLAPFIRAFVRWFDGAQERLGAQDPELLELLWERVLDALEAHPDSAGSAVLVTGGRHDWILEAINSPAGRLAELAVHYTNPQDTTQPLVAHWLDRLSLLLLLPGDVGLHAFVLVLRNINYLHNRARKWSEEHLLSRRFQGEDTRRAFWAGVFRAKGLSPDLAAVLNPEIVGLVAEHHDERGWNEALASFLLWGWGREDLRANGSAISSTQMREALLAANEALRLQVLRTGQRWMVAPDRTWDDRAVELIKTVWPRQNVARSADASAAIARFIMAGGPIFPVLLDAGEDLLEPLTGDRIWMFDVETATSLAETLPEPLLRLFLNLLSEEASNWPYRIDRVLDVLAAGPMAQDPRLQELRRRWAAR